MMTLSAVLLVPNVALMVWHFIGLQLSGPFLVVSTSTSVLPARSSTEQWKSMLQSLVVGLSWAGLEIKLRAAYQLVGNCATIGTYYNVLAAGGYLPRWPAPGLAFVDAVQQIINHEYSETLTDIWSSYMCSHLQHNDWADFAAANNIEIIDTWGIPFPKMIAGLTEVLNQI